MRSSRSWLARRPLAIAALLSLAPALLAQSPDVGKSIADFAHRPTKEQESIAAALQTSLVALDLPGMKELRAAAERISEEAVERCDSINTMDSDQREATKQVIITALANYAAWFAPGERVFANGRYTHHRAEWPEFLQTRRGLGIVRSGDGAADLREAAAVFEKYKLGYAAVAGTATDPVSVKKQAEQVMGRMWGDPEAGFTRLHDSNYDWGQGLPELRDWNAAHNGGRRLAVWYYGTDPAILYPPFRMTTLSRADLTDGDAIPGLAGRGYLAVGVSALYGHIDVTPSSKVAADWLLARRPVARTHSFLIFDLSAEPVTPADSSK